MSHHSPAAAGWQSAAAHDAATIIDWIPVVYFVAPRPG